MAIDVAEVKRRLVTLLGDVNVVNEYIRQFGPAIDMKHIKAIKENRLRSVRVIEEGVGDDPLFELMLECPVCGRKDIPSYELRAKSQAITQNKFLVPIYQGASGFKTVDYTMLGVTVCPRCLFASPDKKDFNRAAVNHGPETKTQLLSNVLMTLQEKIGERKALMKSVTNFEEYFKRPRIDEAAIMSYRLAVSRASVEAWYEQPYSLYKQGAYTLKIAKILKDGGNDNAKVLRETLEFFEEAFRTSNCPSEEIEMQVVYTIVALNIKLGDCKKGNSFIGVFSNLHNSRATEMKTNPKLNLMTIDKWADKANRLWEDREDPDVFKNE